MKGISGQRAWQLASFVFFFGLWELAGRWPVSPAFPPFSTTFLALVEMLRDGSLGKAYLITLEPLLIGVALCAAVGIAFGVGMVSYIAKLAVGGALLALFETTIAKMRVFRLPGFIGAALMLGLLGTLLLFVSRSL